MKVALVTLGSAGDLYPFLEMGRVLQHAGHEVHVLTQAPYQPLVEVEGLLFDAIASQRDHDRTLTHPKLWHPIDGLGVLWRHLAVPAVEPTVEALDRLSRPRDGGTPLVVIANPLCVGARFAFDRWPERVRWATAYTAPLALREPAGPLFFGTHAVPRWVPPAAKALVWRAIDRWKLEPMARPRLETWQRHWKTTALAPSVFGDWMHSPVSRIGLYPDWWGSSRPQRVPPTFNAIGFPLYRPASAPSMPAPVRRFLGAPGPLAILYLGSAAPHTPLATRVTGALAAVGYRTLHITPFLRDHCTDAPNTASPDHASGPAVLRAGPLPLHEVLQHASLLVHHGGIGTLAEGWDAGVPQLLLPQAYDQFDNAQRATGAGFARWLAPARATPERMTAAIRALRPSTRLGGCDPASIPHTGETFHERLRLWFTSEFGNR